MINIGKNFQQFMEEMDKKDRTKSIPDQYVMVTRVCILMRGLGRLLKVPPIHLAEQWKPIALQALKDLKEEEQYN